MVQPPPRNAVDKDLAPWNSFEANQTSWDHHVDTPICPVSAGETHHARQPSLEACFYFEGTRQVTLDQSGLRQCPG
jgi:hypothetical protein